MIDARRTEVLTSIVLLFSAGIFFAQTTAPSFGIVSAALLAMLLGAGITARHNANYAAILFAAAFFLLGALRFLAADTVAADDISRFAGQEVTVTGTVRNEPQIFSRADGATVRYTVDVKSIARNGQRQKATGGMFVSTTAKENMARIGDAITVTGAVRLPTGYKNPGQIDRRMFLKSQGITARMSTGKRPVKIEPTDGFYPTRFAAAIRTHYRQALAQAMPEEDAAAVFAMLFGGYVGIKEDLLDAFSVTGIIHILSVSGSHISLLAATMAFLGAAFSVPLRLRVLFILAAIFLYSLLAGFEPPVIRSALMGALTFVALALERESDAKRLLAIVAGIMLFAEPLLLFNISFQLSFAATAGLLYLLPKVLGTLKTFLPRFVAVPFAVTIAAQAATLPIVAWYFNMVSLSALPANLVVVPLVEVIIIVGLAAGIIAAILPIVGRIVFALDGLLLALSYALTQLIAALPAAAIYLPTPNLPIAAAYYLLLALAIAPKNFRQKVVGLWQKHRDVWSGTILFVAVFFAATEFVLPPQVAVHFIDVGQGNAALIVTPHLHAFMIDTGGTRDDRFDVGKRVDLPYLLHYGVRKLDYIFLTHAHEDHAAGAGSLLKKLPINAVVTANEPRLDYARSMGLGQNAREMAYVVAGKEGEIFNVDGVTVEILFAPTGTINVTGNELSNVYRVSYGDISFLFTGDLIAEQEHSLLHKGIDPTATVLQVGHHGSTTSSSPEFITAVAPRFAVVSVGADNSFGHPRAEVLDRLQSAGTKIFRTDKDGAIVFRTDGKNLQSKVFCR